ncbi:MAG TPA: hypothetical protein VHU84_17125, partial [Lacipirellulaceae bacterium]|nr:hypothetical protein [Lacipirellulaceae bacterium]
MSKQRRFLGLGLAFAVVMTAGAESASAATYVASLLAPVGFNYSNAYGIGGSGIVGTTEAPFDESHPNHYSDAALWNATTNSLVSLNPGSDWHSSAFGASNDSQVGQGSGSAENDHALLWHGTAASFVDLNPAGFYTSEAYGVSGNNQVGGGGLLANLNG